MNRIKAYPDLVFVDYSDLLEKILYILEQNTSNQKIFRISNQPSNKISHEISHQTDKQELSKEVRRLLIDVDKIAYQVAQLKINNPVLCSGNIARSATINISPGSQEKFHQQIQQIRNFLKQALNATIENRISIEDFITSLTTDLEAFKSNHESLDFSYPFKSYEGLNKQSLSFINQDIDGNKSHPLLKVHKLTISVEKANDFPRQLQQSLENYMQVRFAGATAMEKEDLEFVLEDLDKDKNSDFYKLQKIVNTETLGKLKKQAQINYLEFLLENIDIENNPLKLEGSIYLQDLIRRLKIIENYINDSSKADGDYLVNYQGVEVNYRDMFSRAEAFDSLPIIPKIEGYLGEIKDDDKGKLEFVFGIKLKLDGKVQTAKNAEVKTTFDYYIRTLNPDDKSHQEALIDKNNKDIFARRVLKIAFLYFFVFASRHNPEQENNRHQNQLEYDPIEAFEKKCLSILQSGDENAKKQLFRTIIKGFEKFHVQLKINRLKSLIINLLQKKTIFPNRDYPLHIVVKNSVLEDDKEKILTNNTFFKPVVRGNPKDVLKYISIGEATAKSTSLCTIPGKISISDIHFFATQQKETFSMEYDLKGIRSLPILFAPQEEKSCQDIYKQNFLHRQLILFPYRLEANNLEPHQAFIYKFTFSLLAYTCLHILLEKQKILFLPILRLHLHNKQDNKPVENFIVSLSATLSHLLNEKHRSNSQGIDIRNTQYKIPNVLSSLYSILPKKFIFKNNIHMLQHQSQLDKVAMIIVSSRESDRQWNGQEKISNLMGEIMVFRREKNTVRIQLFKSFSDNYDSEELFTYPSVIIDDVKRLYGLGFRHFIYVAKAPYTSTLHMTQKDEDEELFFLSKKIIKALVAEYQDIQIYPMFFDKYYAVKLQKIRESSLYIQDTMELTNLVNDPSKKSVVFFNLFNGITVGQDGRHYNGVISYATLLNIYHNILDDKDIRKGLIYDGELKNNILKYITLFHFSRYQKASKQINLKLDPYENLIGEESVGALSLFNHQRRNTQFNSLAFLTEVKKILNVN